MYLIDSPWFCWVSDRFWMDLVGFLIDWRRVGKAEVDMEVAADVVEAKEEDKEEKKEKKEEDNKIGVAEKSFHYCHAWCRFVIAILGLVKGVPFVDLFSCFFFISVLYGNQLFGNWIRFLESKLLLIKSEGCFEKDLLYLTLLAILNVNGANWLFSIGEKVGVGKKVSTIAMLGPLLAIPSGQGLNMTLLAILKVNRANWLLVLEKKWSCGKMFLLLTRYHYWSDNIRFK